MIGQPIADLEKVTEVPSGSAYIANMGDGSGTKTVPQEILTKEVGRALKVGDLSELQTENKNNLVAAINEAAQSGGGGSAVDILDTKEEIEANTETGKAAGALAVQEMFGALNDNLGGNILTYNESEDAYYVQHGADSVPKKLGNTKDNLHVLTGTTASGEVTIPKNLEFVCIQYSCKSTSVSSQAANYSHNVSCACSASYDPATGKCSFWCQGKTNGANGKTVYGNNYEYKIMYWQD